MLNYSQSGISRMIHDLGQSALAIAAMAGLTIPPLHEAEVVIDPGPSEGQAVQPDPAGKQGELGQGQQVRQEPQPLGEKALPHFAAGSPVTKGLPSSLQAIQPSL